MDENENRKTDYNQEKMKRIAVGITVAGVLLILFLLIVLIVQFVQIGVKRAELKSLDKQIAEYEETIKNDENWLDEWENGSGLYFQAVKQGWKSK